MPTPISVSRRSRTQCRSYAIACTRGGQAREIDVAWVSVPDLGVHRDHQIYEPLRPGLLRFRSPQAGFERVIELTAAGFVRDYPDIAQLVATFGRAG